MMGELAFRIDPLRKADADGPRAFSTTTWAFAKPPRVTEASVASTANLQIDLMYLYPFGILRGS